MYPSRISAPNGSQERTALSIALKAGDETHPLGVATQYLGLNTIRISDLLEVFGDLSLVARRVGCIHPNQVGEVLASAVPQRTIVVGGRRGY
jgi:hypothetical protein